MEQKQSRVNLNSSYNVSSANNLDGSPNKWRDSNKQEDFASTSFTQDLSNVYKGTKGFFIKAVGGKPSTTSDKVDSK